MSERKDEQWLDSELRRAVDGTTPVFDAQAWQQRHRAAYEVLLSRRNSTKIARQGMPHLVVLGRWFGALAVAAAVIVVAGVLLLSQPEPDSHRPTPGPAAPVPSPAQMMTMMSLQAAYQHGGTEELERQFDKAMKMLGPRTTSMSVNELLQG